MKSYKCTKAEVHRVRAKVLRNAPAIFLKKTTKDRGRGKEGDKEGETGSRRDDEENLADIE